MKPVIGQIKNLVMMIKKNRWKGKNHIQKQTKNASIMVKIDNTHETAIQYKKNF